MTAIALEDLTIGRGAQDGVGGQGGEAGGGGLPAERDDFHGDGFARAEAVDQFALVDDDDQAAGGDGHDFLAQQRSAVPFDQVQGGRFHLVGTVDGEVDGGV